MNNEGIVIGGYDSSGNTVDTRVLEEHGVALDPAQVHLDLTKEEKRRTTALLLAIQAYQNLIIKDAEYLREANRLGERDEALKIRPATMNAMVSAAIDFDDFISGKLQERIEQQDKTKDRQRQTEGAESTPEAKA